MENKNPKGKKIAIVHDFLFQYGGAEKVVEKVLEIFPDADIYTSFVIEEKFNKSEILKKALKANKIYTTSIQKIFNIRDKEGKRSFTKFQKHFFFLYPILMRGLKVENYDFVFISSTDCGKNIKLKDNKEVVHYCHSPTRYLHNLTPEINKKSLNIIYRIIIPFFSFFLKKVDLNAVKRLNMAGTKWFANSEFIQRTIWEVYKTKSLTLYPPVEIGKFLEINRQIPENKSKQFYLSFGRISFHKRIDIAIKACLKLKKRLIVGGTSPLESDLDYLKKIIKDHKEKTGDNTDYIEFVGRIDDEKYFEYQSKATAFLFPGKEDFGITPVECLAAGVPVIAYGKGGALEYVKNNINGIIFKHQTVKDLVEAIEKFETQTFKTQQIKDSARGFDPSVFENKIKSFVE